MSDHVCQIYVLFNLDGDVDYVGRTARDIRKRMTSNGGWATRRSNLERKSRA
jgi:hypothetical protein